MKPKFIIFILAISLLYACGSDCPDSKDYLIPENEKIKLQRFDTLIYLSNQNNFDTIWVEHRYESKVTIIYADEFFCNYEIRKEGIHYDLKINNKDTTNDQSFINQYLLGQNNEILVQTIRLNDNFFDDSLRYYIGDYTIGESIYKNVSKFENIDNEIFQIYTNLDYGIIKYCYKNGEEFILHKFIP